MPATTNGPIQKILFGPPGSGKSYRARTIGKQLEVGNGRTIEVTFHPAYDYGDFVAKLLPMTVRRSRTFEVADTASPANRMYSVAASAAESLIEYRVHAGHLIRAIAKALQVGPEKNVLLIIDEINRGECARIFGDMFQLLDRDASGWSNYGVNLSDLTFAALMEELGWTCEDSNGALQWKKADKVWIKGKPPEGIWSAQYPKQIQSLFGVAPVLHLPANLSIVGTMNTSDESVYYMDTAFKRRWGFEFIKWDHSPSDDIARIGFEAQKFAYLENTQHHWVDFLDTLNFWIADKSNNRRVDDKQVGMWFLKAPIDLYVSFQRLSNTLQMSRWLAAGLPVEGWPIENGSSVAGEWVIGNDLRAKFEEMLGDTQPALFQACDNYFTGIQQTNNRRANNVAIWLAGDDAKQYWCHTISKNDLQFKLMHFLWDNVFSRDRTPLEDLVYGLGRDKQNERLRTFDDFVANHEIFIDSIMKLDKNPRSAAQQ